ncbi:MAG TPA: hypothetical protein VKB47_07865 [Terracidiphilus sp.]|nr:hypothetical protein [Terracidiphilus sp.]
MKALSVLLLFIAGIASLAMSGFGLFAGAWGGFGTGGHAVLGLLFWFLPAMSIFAFGIYFLSRSVGLMCLWAISVGSMITIYAVNLQSCLAGQCTTTNPIKIALGVFLLPHIWILLIASITLYAAARIENKIAHLTPGNEPK